MITEIAEHIQKKLMNDVDYLKEESILFEKEGERKINIIQKVKNRKKNKNKKTHRKK